MTPLIVSDGETLIHADEREDRLLGKGSLLPLPVFLIVVAYFLQPASRSPSGRSTDGRFFQNPITDYYKVACGNHGYASTDDTISSALTLKAFNTTV